MTEKNQMFMEKGENNRKNKRLQKYLKTFTQRLIYRSTAALLIVSVASFSLYMVDNPSTTSVSANLLDLVSPSEQTSQALALKKALIKEKKPSFKREAELENVKNVQAQVGSMMHRFNVYRGKNEEQLMENNKKYHVETQQDFLETYKEHIGLIVSRVNNNKKENKLAEFIYPLNLEYNIATYGNVSAVLFPDAQNPLQYAKEKGYIKNSAHEGEYLSKLDFIETLEKIFFPNSNQDASNSLYRIGVVASASDWKSESKDGFPLADALTVLLRVRDIVDAQLLTRSQESQKLESLGDSALSFNTDVFNVLLKSFNDEAQEYQEKIATPLKPIQKEDLYRFFSNYEGKPLKADMVASIRNEFRKQSGLSQRELTVLPKTIDLGDCSEQLHRKSVMSSVISTGDKGASIHCHFSDQEISFYIPSDTVAVNFNALAKLTPLVSSVDSSVARVELIQKLDNTFLAGKSGEVALEIGLNSPEKLNGQAALSFTDSEGKSFAALKASYNKGKLKAFFVPRGLAQQLNTTESSTQFYAHFIANYQG